MAVQSVDPHDVFRLYRDGKPVQLIDVRTPGEFEAMHAEGARSVPLDQLNGQSVADATGEPVYVICQSGARGAKACERLQAAGLDDVFNVAGGTVAWEKAGLPVVQGVRKVISLERQVRVGAGSLVLLGGLLGWHVHPAFHALSAVVGAGLVFAGVTDWCGMGLLLARLPWNRRSGSTPDACAP